MTALTLIIGQWWVTCLNTRTIPGAESVVSFSWRIWLYGGRGGRQLWTKSAFGEEGGRADTRGADHCFDYTGVHNCTLLLLNLPHALLCIAVNGDTICELRNLENKTSPSPSSHTCNESLCPASSTHYIAQESAHFYPVHLTSGYQLCLGCYNSILTGLSASATSFQTNIYTGSSSFKRQCCPTL